MEINNTLASAAYAGRHFDNGHARVRKEQTPPTAIAPPSAIYHGSNDEIPDIGYDGPRDYTIKVEAALETSNEQSARISKMIDLVTTQLGATSIRLKHGYDAAMATLSPELQHKDWGFSVSDGQLTISEDTDPLSASERAAIRSAFSDYSIEYLSNQVADTVIAGVKAERGPDDASRGFGQYDLTASNFGDTIDLRAYLESHTEGGKYEMMTTALSNPHDDGGVYMFTGIMAMVDQLSARAAPTYAERT